MNQLSIDELQQNNDEVELVVVDGKVKWVDCINRYPLNTKIKDILKNINHGTIKYKENYIESVNRLKNY